MSKAFFNVVFFVLLLNPLWLSTACYADWDYKAGIDVIPGVTVVGCSSEQSSVSINRKAKYLVNGYGTGFGIEGEGTHSTHPMGTMWFSGDGTVASGQWVKFDFGKTYDLDSTLIWNYDVNDTTWGTNCCVHDVNVMVSADDSTYTNLGTFTLNSAPKSDTVNFAQRLVTKASSVRYVKLVVKSNYGNGPPNYVGLSEVRFTAAPYPNEKIIRGVKIQAVSGANPGYEADHLVDGYGLGINGVGTHAMWPVGNMWLPGGIAGQWVTFDLGTTYTLGATMIWNWNSNGYFDTTAGVKDVNVMVSPDNSSYTNLGKFTLTKSDGLETSDLRQVLSTVANNVRYVKLYIVNNWGGASYAGLSEVRFREAIGKTLTPFPANGSTGIDPTVILEWVKGDYAQATNAHRVFFGTTFDSVNNATTDSAEYKGVQTGTTYDPCSLSDNATYYWRIDEVNSSDGNSPWKGDVWSFTVSPGTANANYYVASDGNDNNAGTSVGSPFKTITKARDVIRVCTSLPAGGVTVSIRGGVYFLDAPIVFGPDDSGTASAPITYSAYAGEVPLICGGKVITSWTSIGSDTYTTTLSDVADGKWWFRSFFVDGVRSTRARWPNAGAALPTVTAVANAYKTITLSQSIPGTNGTGIESDDTELVMYHSFTAGHAKVVDKGTNSVTTETVCGTANGNLDTSPTSSPAKPCFLENNSAYIDVMNEWSLRRSDGLLTYKMPTGVNPNNCWFVAPKLDQLICIIGTKDNPVQYLNIKGLFLGYTTWPMPDFGYPGIQATHYISNENESQYAIPPAVEMYYARNCKINRCLLAHIGSNAIALSAGCRNNQIIDCKLTDIGGQAVTIGWRGSSKTGLIRDKIDFGHNIPDWLDTSNDTPQNNLVSNNYMIDLGVEWFDAVGIYEACSKSSKITKNILSNMPYTGIDIGFWCSTAYNAYSENDPCVSNNHIQYCMQKLNDGGGLYTIGNLRGTDGAGGAYCTGNLIHDVQAGWAAYNLGNGVYLDGYTDYITVKDTITYNIAGNNHWEQNTSGYEPQNYSYVTDHWGETPGTWGAPEQAIAAAAGTTPSTPNDLTIAWSAGYGSFTVTGNSETWAALYSAKINETNTDVKSYLSINYTGAISGTIPASLVTSSTVTLKVVTSDPDGHTSPEGTSNTLNVPNAPTFVAAGAVASNTTAITPALPANIATGDILLLFLETANQAITIPTPNGGTWTEVTNSPQGTGTAGGTTGARLTIFWSRYNGSQGDPTTSDSGDHQQGRIIAIRGVTTSGNPWDITTGGTEAVSDTSGLIPGATTTVPNTLVVTAIATSLPDATGTSNFSSWTNSNLTSITECIDNTVTAGNGGGLGIVTGIKATAGVYGNTAVTLGSSTYKGMTSIAIKP